ncbi:MAG: class I SAM-dependent methyltransferase [Flavobacteriales bacterium]
MNKKNIKTKKSKKPWPTKDAMEQIYEKKLWGSNQSKYYSGIGSHQLEIINPYLDSLKSFLRSFKNPLVVCDLGCGDFNVGKNTIQFTKKYIAVDIVRDLISYNKNYFKEKNLEFHCLDIAIDELPNGDCVILRQVLQHLSNTEIQQIIKKLAKYKYVIVTEHIPEGVFIPNIDLISGQGIRLKKQSGVDLLAPPFNFKVKKEKQLVSINLNNNKGIIVTYLYEVF